MSDWWVEQTFTRAQWKYAFMESGVLCVTALGAEVMQLLFVGSWASQI